MNQSAAGDSVVLLVEDTSKAPEGFVSALEQLGQVIRAPSLDEALAQVDEDQPGWVIISLRERKQLPRTRTAFPASRILEVIDQGACLLKPNGELIWANKLFRSLPAEVRNRVRKTCQEAFLRLTAHKHVRTRRFCLHTDDDQYFDLVATPITNRQGGLTQVACTTTPVTATRRLQKKMQAIDQAGRELMQLDADKLSKLNVQQRLQLVEEKVVHYMKGLMQYEHFSIHLLDRKTNRLELVLSAGLTRESELLDIYASPEGNGICGYVAATGRSYICPDCNEDPRYVHSMENAGSCLAVPLKLHDKVIGVFNVESERVGAFTEDDRQFAEMFSRYLAVALNILDLLAVERSTTTGQLAVNVSSEIAAPLNDILSDAGTLMEDYVGQDDLRARLRTIIDNAVTIRESIKQVGRPASGFLGKRTTEQKIDPALKGKRIFVIDDDQTIRETIRDVLVRLGCEVETARDGAEAEAMIDQRRYDLVVSDIKMPYHNGYEIFALVKNADPDCPVMLMTGFGYDPNHSIIRARQEGLAAVLFKPFKIDQLLEEIRRALKIERQAAPAGKDSRPGDGDA
jgi:CheY-like chemotaxis protein